MLVVVRGRDQVHEYSFADVSGLRVFQADMEAFLRRTGWTLLKFYPERGGGNGIAGVSRGSGTSQMVDRSQRAVVCVSRLIRTRCADPKDNFPAWSC